MSSPDRLMVVDDDPASALSLKVLLEAYEYDVQVFHSAEEFLDSYDGQSPGCLVLDLRLTGMSGLDLQKDLAHRGVRLPIVMISGHADDKSHAQAIENGAIAFLQKPFSGCDLVTAIQRANAMAQVS